jgi:hypothetical protein
MIRNNYNMAPCDPQVKALQQCCLDLLKNKNLEEQAQIRASFAKSACSDIWKRFIPILPLES